MPGSLLLDLSLGGLGAGVAVLAAAVLGPVLRVGQPRSSGLSRSLATIQERYARQVPGATDPTAEPLLPGWLRKLLLRLSPSGLEETIQRRLDMAGNPDRWSPDRLLAAKGLGLVVLAFMGGINGLNGLHSLWYLLLGAAVFGTVGFFVPDVLLYNAGVRRQNKIQLLLPNALDMLTISVEAGMAFDASLSQVARKTSGPLAAEFSRVLLEMQIGKSRTEALNALTERSGVPELKTFIFSIVQATELGIPMAQVLRDQAKELRLKRRQRAEERAQQLSVKILFPLITCLFPALMLIVIGPGIIQIAGGLFGH